MMGGEGGKKKGELKGGEGLLHWLLEMDAPVNSVNNATVIDVNNARNMC